MQISDEQYKQVGRTIIALVPTTTTFDVGRAAVAAVAPLLLAEPQPEESGRCDARYRVATCMGDALRLFVANRLASLTAKPDPAVEAVTNVLREASWISGPNPESRTEVIHKIVAAVDAARAK